jgi:hypothetical protein
LHGVDRDNRGGEIMNVKEVSEEKRKVEAEILGILKDFMKETGCRISGIGLSEIEFVGDKDGGHSVYSLTIDARIPS